MRMSRSLILQVGPKPSVMKGFCHFFPKACWLVSPCLHEGLLPNLQAPISQSHLLVWDPINLSKFLGRYQHQMTEFVPGEFFKTISCRVADSFRWRSANAPVMQVLIFHMVTATVSARVSLVGPRDPCDSILHVYLSLCVCICTHTLIHAYIYILAWCS